MSTIAYGSPLDGNSLGSLYYTLFSTLGDPFGILSGSDAASYSDLCLRLREGSSFDWVSVYDPNTVLFGLVGSNSSQSWLQQIQEDSYYKNGNTYYLNDTFTQQQYNDSLAKGSLFGIPWLGWNTWIIKTAGGKYAGMHLYGSDTLKMLNPLGKEPLMMKMQTIGILAGSFAVLYFGGKFALKRLRS
jgi:hypothetical protein